MKILSKDFFSRFRLGDAGFLDNIRYENGVLLLGGWSVCKNEEPYQRPQKIHVVYGDRFIGEITNFAADRPDVAKAFAGFPLECGFSEKIYFACEEFEPLLTELFAESGNGNIYQLHKDQKYTFLFQLEPTGKCNLRCAQCPNTVYSGFNNRDISEEDIDAVSDMIRKSSTICYDGFGEFFLSRNIHKALEKTPLRSHVIVHTNGMLLDKNYDLVLNNAPPLRQLIVSLDSLREDRYGVIREGGSLWHVLANMRGLKKRRDRLGRTLPYIVPNMKIMNLNFDEFEDFIDLAAEFDSYLELVYLYDARKMSGSPEEDGLLAYEKQQPRFHSRQIATAVERAMEYARGKGVCIVWSGACPEPIRGTKDENDYIGTRRPIYECPMADCSTAMQLDGKIMFCVWQTSPLFNWRVEETTDLQRHPRAVRARAMIKKGIIPHECSGACCQFVGREISLENNNSCGNEVYSGGWQA
ncbi:MAG: radical SAM protein [Desulfarculales bacterium]|jgi:molybdenum cofactor biosynthesis enzyme MoaA|nr:radical SAM protein [Desulfarculales bacterium]